MTYKLPDDYARCHGSLLIDDPTSTGEIYAPCPSRDQCLRYLARSTANDNWSWMLAPPDETGRCCKYLMPAPESKPDCSRQIADDIANECGQVETERDKYFAPDEYWR